MTMGSLMSEPQLVVDRQVRANPISIATEPYAVAVALLKLHLSYIEQFLSRAPDGHRPVARMSRFSHALRPGHSLTA